MNGDNITYKDHGERLYKACRTITAVKSTNRNQAISNVKAKGAAGRRGGAADPPERAGQAGWLPAGAQDGTRSKARSQGQVSQLMVSVDRSTEMEAGDAACPPSPECDRRYELSHQTYYR